MTRAFILYLFIFVSSSDPVVRAALEVYTAVVPNLVGGNFPAFFSYTAVERKME